VCPVCISLHVINFALLWLSLYITHMQRAFLEYDSSFLQGTRALLSSDDLEWQTMLTLTLSYPVTLANVALIDLQPWHMLARAPTGTSLTAVTPSQQITAGDNHLHPEGDHAGRLLFF